MIKANNNINVALIAVEAAIAQIYTYLIPPQLEAEIKIGQMVLVPLGYRKAIGYIINIKKINNFSKKLKPINKIIQKEALFGKSISNLIYFVSSYYHYPPGLSTKSILPGGLSPKLERKIKLINLNYKPQELIGAESDLINLLQIEAQTLKELEKKGFKKEIKNLLNKNVLEDFYELQKSSVKIKYEYWLEVKDLTNNNNIRLGPREKQLLELAKGAAKPLSYFRTYLPNPLTQAKTLAQKGFLHLYENEVMRDNPARAIYPQTKKNIILTAEQKTALKAISQSLKSEKFTPFLLFGVTGSGKTEVYLEAALKTLALGKEVLWLAPEIALTLLLEGRLKEKFQENSETLAILHSGLTRGEKYDHWLKVSRGEAKVVIGARSAVFAPLENIGLIIVDEEHDWSYKQEDGLKYNGRDLAVWRAKEFGATLILGSATPSLESYQAVLDNKYNMLTLKNRAGQAVLPNITIVDQREALNFRQKIISPLLKKALTETLAREEQALFFINRRGMANVALCLSCGESFKCPHCNVNLTLHDSQASYNNEEVLLCHHCGYRAIPPKDCPFCSSKLFKYLGVGTEKLLELVENNYENVKGLKLDADAIKQKGSLKSILNKFINNEYNFLTGTQMVVKGHNFPNLTLVGVIEADQGLNLPDFRAAERTFQLLSQVAGRAGRAEKPGEVIIQTYNPNHYALKAAAEHDYEYFFQNEISLRKNLLNPPFARLALLRIIGPSELITEKTADDIAQKARQIMNNTNNEELEIYGPAPSPINKIKDQYRFQIMLRALTVKSRHTFLNQLLKSLKLPPELKFTIDIDPYFLL